MSRYRKVLMIGIPAVVILIVVIALAATRNETTEKEPPTAAGVVDATVETVSRQAYPVEAEVPGTVMAIRHADLSPKVMSHIAAVYVREGDRVSAGQLLARLEARDLTAGVQQASAGVLNAEAAYEQAKTAYTMQRTQSSVAIQQAEAALAQAKAQLAKAKQGPRPEQVKQAEEQEQRAKAGYEQAVAMLNLTKEGARAQQKRQADQAVLAAQQQVTQAEAEVATAKANLNTVQADYDRMKNLLAQDIIPKQKFDYVSTQLEAAKQSVRQAEAGLAQAKAGVEMAKEQASLVYEGARSQEVTAAEKQIEQARADYEQAKQEAAMAKQGGRWEDVKTAEEGVHQAEAAVRAANAAQARDAVSEKDIARARAGISQAQAGLTGAQTMQSYAFVTAPFGGVITARRADPGTMAMPQMPILSVDDDSLYQLVCDEPEKLASVLHKGTTVRVRLDSLKQEVSATIAEVVPSADPATRTLTVKANLPRLAGLQSGVFGRMSINTGNEATLTVASGAVVDRDGLTGVYVVDADGIARYTLVTTGKSFGERVQVLSGVRAGQLVVVTGLDKVTSGTRIRKEGAAL